MNPYSTDDAPLAFDEYADDINPKSCENCGVEIDHETRRKNLGFCDSCMAVSQ